MKIRLNELFMVTAVTAFLIASLVGTIPNGRDLFVAFSLILLVAGLPLAIAKRAGDRSFWIGFFVAGILYLAFSRMEDKEGYIPRMVGREYTTRLAVYAFKKFDQSSHKINENKLRPSLVNVDGQVVEDKEEALVESGALNSVTGDDISDSNPGNGTGGVFGGASAGATDNGGLGGGLNKSEYQGPTNEDFQLLIDLIHRSVDVTDSDSNLSFPSNAGGIISYPYCAEGFFDFVSICHSGWALLFAWIFGRVSRFTFEKWPSRNRI